jgi:D-arabinose 1-dehydrogenase-like Zn-dependent alcohol dehydrogenase
LSQTLHNDLSRHASHQPARHPARWFGVTGGTAYHQTGRMIAVSYSAPQTLPVLGTRPDPDCPRDGVVVRVRATGVCRSDWHAWMGHDPVALPHVPGHELAGEVASVGGGVRRWSPGDRVTVPFVCGCGVCGYCRAGDSHVCPEQTQPGFTGPGSFAELVAIHAADTNLVRLPDAMDYVTAASLGCRLATAYRALVTHGRLAPGQWLAVHGCGGVGLSAILVGVALGAQVVAVDVSAAARQRAVDLGATAVPHDGAVSAIRQVTGDGADVSVDAAGTPSSAVASVRCLRRRGRHIQVGLLFGDQSTPPLPLDLVVAWELSVHGSHGMPAHQYGDLLRLVMDGTLDPALLVGRVIELRDAPDALVAMSRPPETTGMTVVRLPG